MKEDWLEIVVSLSPYFQREISESEYQHEIEGCLQLLKWRKSNGTMESQASIPIGNNNSIRPDLLLRKIKEDGTLQPVLPIEIKRPDNIKSERQEAQLMSYMRQLKLNVGLYIGENIQLFYDTPENGESPISILTAKIKPDDEKGILLCEYLSYDNFNLEKLEAFCKEQYRKIQARNNLHKRISEFLAEENAISNITELLKEKFVMEGFEEQAILNELSTFNITIKKKTNPTLYILPTIQTSQSIIEIEKPTIINHKKLSKYSFDGIIFHNKRRFVLEVIKHYVKEHPFITYPELQKQFPDYLHSNSLGVVRLLSDIKHKMIERPDIRRRYFLNPNEIITLSDGNEIVVNNQWGDLFPNFLEVAKQLYKITTQ